MHQSYPITQIIPNIFHNYLLYATAITSCAGFTFHTFQVLSMIRTTSYHIKNIHLESLVAISFSWRKSGCPWLFNYLHYAFRPSYPRNPTPISSLWSQRRLYELYASTLSFFWSHAMIQPLMSVKFLQTPLDPVFRGIQISSKILLSMDKPIVKLIVVMYLCMLMGLYASWFAYAAIVTNELNSDTGNPRCRYKRRCCMSENTFNSINCYTTLIYLVFAAGINSIEGAGSYDSFGLVFLPH